MTLRRRVHRASSRRVFITTACGKGKGRWSPDVDVGPIDLDLGDSDDGGGGVVSLSDDSDDVGDSGDEDFQDDPYDLLDDDSDDDEGIFRTLQRGPPRAGREAAEFAWLRHLPHFKPVEVLEREAYDRNKPRVHIDYKRQFASDSSSARGRPSKKKKAGGEWKRDQTGQMCFVTGQGKTVRMGKNMTGQRLKPRVKGGKGRGKKRGYKRKHKRGAASRGR